MTPFHWQPNWCKIIPSYAWNFKSQHLSKDFLPHTLQLLRYRSVHCSSASCPPRPTGATPRCLGRHDPNTSSPRWHVSMLSSRYLSSSQSRFRVAFTQRSSEVLSCISEFHQVEFKNKKCQWQQKWVPFTSSSVCTDFRGAFDRMEGASSQVHSTFQGNLKTITLQSFVVAIGPFLNTHP